MRSTDSNDIITLYTPEEVSDILQIGLNSTYDILRSGKLKGMRVGRIWKVPKVAIEQYILSECNLAQ